MSIMISMMSTETNNGFTVYQLFVALKNHFRNSTYDFFKYNGKVTASFDSYMKRKDRFFFEKISRNTPKSDIQDLIVANLVYGENGLEINPDAVWIGLLASPEGKERLLKYRARMESLEYNFKKDLTTITEHAKVTSETEDSQFPMLLGLYFDGKISPETIIIFDSILGMFNQWDKKLGQDPLWTKTKKFLVKYKSLLSSSIHDTKKYKKLMSHHAKSETI